MLKNNYELSEEKIKWLEEIRAFEFKNPVIYGIPKENGVSYTLSEKYLKETPVDELKKNYKRLIPLFTKTE